MFLKTPEAFQAFLIAMNFFKSPYYAFGGLGTVIVHDGLAFELILFSRDEVSGNPVFVHW